jgi:hypothetical protein
MASLTTILYLSISSLALLIAIGALFMKLLIPGPMGPVGYRGPMGATGTSYTGNTIIGPTGPLGPTGSAGDPGAIDLISNGGCVGLEHGNHTLGVEGGSVNGIIYVFGANEGDDLTLTIPASNVTIGDIFTIYNMSPKTVTLDIKDQGFQNEDGSADKNAYTLNSGVDVALIFITAGKNDASGNPDPTNKNINIMFSMYSSKKTQ